MAAFEQTHDEDEAIAAINIIPFVDIVLVLLIIFMVTSTAIIKASFEVDLPKAASGGESVESTVNLVLTRQDELFLNGAAMSRDEIGAAIRGEARGNPKLQAVISADTAVDYGKVIALIDLVKANGVKTFALNIERRARAGEGG